MPNITPEMLRVMQMTAPKPSEVKGKGTSGFNDAMAGSYDAPAQTPQQMNEDRFGDYGMPDTTQYLTESQMMNAQRGLPKSMISNAQAMQYRPNAKSKLPDAIKNVLAKNAGITEQMAQPAMKVTDEARVIMEQTARQTPKISQPTSSTGIDYSIIRAIIKECIDEKFKEMNNQLLNEGSLKTISLKEGNIRLVDNSGNIYKAKLERAGNINDKKK